MPARRWRRTPTREPGSTLGCAAVMAATLGCLVCCLEQPYVAAALTGLSHTTLRPSFLPRSLAHVPAPACSCAATDTRLYDVLGVSSASTVSEIKRAYYREARTAHPDMHPGDEAMQQRFQEVAEAYATLADPVRRQHYDLQGLAALGYMKANATKLFGPPPWRVLIGRTDHWLWEDHEMEHMVGLMVTAIPDGIAGVTVKTIRAAYEEAYNTRVAVLLERVSEQQAVDTVDALEEYGLAVKAEPIEAERSNEKETPTEHFRRIQRELGDASESLRKAAIELQQEDVHQVQKGEDTEFERWIALVRSLRSELRAAAMGVAELKLQKVA